MLKYIKNLYKNMQSHWMAHKSAPMFKFWQKLYCLNNRETIFSNTNVSIPDETSCSGLRNSDYGYIDIKRNKTEMWVCVYHY